MNTMAALLVIVTCHSQDTSCRLDEPVSVASYDDVTQCFMALPKELDQARLLTSAPSMGIVFPWMRISLAGKAHSPDD